MRVFVYEHFTAQGIGRDPGSASYGIYREGRAMHDAVVDDLRRIAGIQVVVFSETDVPVDSRGFTVAANSADWTLVIAPETEGILLSLAEKVRSTSSRFLGPSQEAISLTSNKLRLSLHWSEFQVPTPTTREGDPSDTDTFPIVWKPLDGAGSESTFRLDSSSDIHQARAERETEKRTGPMVVQQLVAGQAASVSFLCGPTATSSLPPLLQVLSVDGRFKYLGGETPIPTDLAIRAEKLAHCAVECVPGLFGYVGVDLVLGKAEDGSRDYAIEINPRLTTSFIGLRKLAEFNLANAMIRIAAGQSVDRQRWKSRQVRFAADGTLLPG